MKNFLRLSSLRINRHLGIGVTTDPIEVPQFSPGLNLIYADNGRGKSCAAAAAVSLIWGKSPDNRSEIRGKIEFSGNKTSIELLGASGSTVANAPPESIAHLYKLSLPELLRAEDGNVAREIRKQLLGNLDPNEAIDNLSYRRTNLNGTISEWKTYSSARDTYNESLSNQQNLARELDSRPLRLQQLAEVENQLSNLQKWHARIANLQAQARSAETHKALHTLDPRIARCSPDDLERYKKLNEGENATAAEIADAAKDREEAIARLEANSFGDSPPPDGPLLRQIEGHWQRIAELRQRVDLEAKQSRDATQRQNLLKQQLSQSQQFAESAKKGLKTLPNTQQLRDLEAKLHRIQQLESELSKATREEKAAAQRKLAMSEACEQTISVDKLESWLERDTPPPATDGILRAAANAEDASARLERLRQERDMLPPKADDSQLADAAQILSRWLEPANNTENNERTFQILLAVTALLAIATVFIGWIGAACTIGCIAAVYWTSKTRQTPRQKAPPETLPQAYCPANWTAQHVAEMLVNATEHLATTRAANTARTTLLARLEDLKEIQQKADDEITKIRNQIQDSCGILPSSAELTTIVYLLHELATLRTAHHESVGASARTAEIKRQLDEQKRKIAERTHHFLNEPAVDPTESIGILQEAANVYDAAVRKLESLEIALQDATQDAKRINDDLADTQAAYSKDLQELRERLQPLTSKTTGDDLDNLQTTIHRLREQTNQYNAAQSDLNSATKRLDQAKRSHEQRIDERKAFSNERQLDSNTDSAPLAEQLRNLVDQIDTFQQASDEHKAALALQAEAQENDDPAFNPSASIDEATARVQSADHLQAQRDRLSDALIRLDEQRRAAEQGQTLTEAEARFRAAREKLATRRRHEAKSRLAHLLIRQLTESVPATTAPILATATNLFAAFTNNRYALQADASSGVDELIAYDNVTQRQLRLEQLSSGTRIQLLLAARLAFLENQESDCRPPLFLDETLANSDKNRTQSIMKALSEIAARGRQIIYLTAETREVADWQSFVDEHAPDLPCRVIALDPFAEVASPSDLRPFNAPTTPVPEKKETMATYGVRIGIPRLAPWRPVTNVHLWYVCEKPSELYDLLMTTGSTCGQIPERDQTTITQRTQILRSLLNHWRINRPRPVSWAAVLDSGIVNQRWEPEIRKAFEQAKGDGRKLEQLVGQIPKFRTNNKETFRKFLADNGYTSPPTISPLSEEEILRGLRREHPEATSAINCVLERCGILFRNQSEYNPEEAV